jgi:hypothetical protein
MDAILKMDVLVPSFIGRAALKAALFFGGSKAWSL